MANFILIRPGYEELIPNAYESFELKELNLSQKISGPFGNLLLFNSKYDLFPEHLSFENGHIFCQGIVAYKDRLGSDALTEIFNDFTTVEDIRSKLLGHFTLIIIKNEQLFMFNDTLGLMHIFHDSEEKFYTGSFITATNLVETKTINSQAFYEYLLTSATYCSDTFITEITRCSCEEYFIFDNHIKKVPHYVLPAPEMTKSKAETIAKTAKDLKESFLIWNNSDKKISSGLSGGFDSRLLAAIYKSLNIDVEYHVSGKEHENDVRIAKEIAQAENLSLEHREIGVMNTIPEDEYPAFIKKQLYRNDASGNHGIFNDGFDWQEQYKQAAKKELVLVGIGGEIYRNFWKMRDKTWSVTQLIDFAFNVFDHSEFTDKFCKETYFRNISEKITHLTKASPKEMKRSQIEQLYPVFRMRYWAGMEVSKRGSYFPLILPFANPQLCQNSTVLPISWKRCGEFEANLIHHTDPQMASYTSEYGFSFSKNLPWKMKASEHLRAFDSPLRKVFRKRKRLKEAQIKNNRDQSHFPYYLNKNYLSSIFNMKDLEISKYIHLEKIQDPGMLSRALTVELVIGDYAKKL